MSLRSEIDRIERKIHVDKAQIHIDEHRIATWEHDVAPLLRALSHPVPRHGIDVAWGHPNPLGLKRAGISFIIRYYSHDASKDLTRAEAEDYSHAGLDICTVWESTANRALGGYDAGVADGKQAQEVAKNVGQPHDAPIYFAVDFDVQPDQEDNVFGYFGGACDVLTRSRVGCYGGLAAVKLTHERNVADYRWQTIAWSGLPTAWYAHAHLRQTRNGVIVAGTECDLDTAVAPHFGQWRL